MMNEKVFHLRYGDRSYCSLATELEQHKERADRAELTLAECLAYFAELEKQEWYRNNRHTITNNIKENT